MDIEILVLDEADRMVDMGFAPDLRRILKLLPARRQTLMFSATMPPELNRVAGDALHDARRVDLAPPSRPAAGITQAVYPISRHLKTDLLDRLLGGADVGSVLVFTRTKHGADRLTRQLLRRGHNVAALHGDRTQSQRERALSGLRRGRIQILVATDIASRGIDVDDISHVINFDVPHTPEDYVHRIGRTGRVEATGDAFTLMSPEEQPDLQAIERFLGRSIPRVTLPDFDYRKTVAAAASVAGARGTEEDVDHSPARGRGRRSGGNGAARSGGESRGATPMAGARSPAPEAVHGRRPKRNVQDRRGRRM
jgi:ATP-dependent RNA helicase RhlE